MKRTNKTKQSKRSRTRLGVQHLENRKLMAADIGLVDTTLSIQGSEFDDTAEVYVENGQLSVTIASYDDAGGLVAEKSEQFAVDEVGRIVFDGASGDDLFVNDTSIDSVVRGGAGNDTVMGGSGDDLIVGGTGDDLILGGGGNDRILVGPGTDVVIESSSGNSETAESTEDVASDTSTTTESVATESNADESVAIDSIDSESVDDAPESTVDEPVNSEGDPATDGVMNADPECTLTGETSATEQNGEIDDAAMTAVEIEPSSGNSETADSVEDAASDTYTATEPVAAEANAEVSVEAESSPVDSIDSESIDDAPESTVDEPVNSESDSVTAGVMNADPECTLDADASSTEQNGEIDDAAMSAVEATDEVVEDEAVDSTSERETESPSTDITATDETNAEDISTTSVLGEPTDVDNIPQQEMTDLEQPTENAASGVDDIAVAETGTESDSALTADAPSSNTQPVATQSQTDNDILFGGEGDDWLMGEGGNDMLFGNSSPLGEELLRSLISGRFGM